MPQPSQAERPVTIENARLHHAVDYTPYEGMRLAAWPGLTLLRGEVVWDGTQCLARPGQGRFLERGAPTLLAGSTAPATALASAAGPDASPATEAGPFARYREA